MEIARRGNKYLADTEPWKLIKTNPDRVKTIMNLAAQVVANITILGEPFLPFTSAKIQKALKVDALKWDQAGSTDLLVEGHTIDKPELLYSKIEDEEIEKQIDKLKAAEIHNNKDQTDLEIDPMKAEISFDDFMKMDMRIGTVLKAEKVEKSNKLLKLFVDTGVDQRTIVSGIAKHFSPEEVVGKQVTVLLNLSPRKIMGIESQGMILLAEDQDKKLVFITPDDSVINGSGVS